MASRTKKSAINSSVGIICSLISSILSFVLQAVFIRLLGVEYSGINSLFTSILSVLNLAELGFGNAVMFRLYKSIADCNDDRTRLYLSVYKKICYCLGAFVFFSGLCCVPFLDKLITTEKTFPEPLWILFVITMSTSAATYFNNYRKILINAKQDRYINTFIDYGFLFACHGLQILGLIVFKNIYLYLLTKLLTTVLNGFVSGFISKRKYKIGWHSDDKLPKEEWKSLSKDVGSLAFYKFCRTLDAHIDTFLISKFVDIAVTGIYGSLNMLLSALNEVLGNFNDGMIASIGNLYASDSDKKHVEEVFYQSTHFTYFIYGIVIAVLAPFLSPFSEWWIGYTLKDYEIYIMLINFYMYGMGMNVATFRNSMGIFVKGWKRPAFTAAANFIFSVILTRRIGLIGTLLGTLIARTLTQIWYDPYLVCKYALDAKPLKYYINYLGYMIIIFFVSFGLIKLNGILPPMDSFISIIWHGILLSACSFLAFFCVSFVFKEHLSVMKRMFGLVKSMFNKFGGRQN